MKRYDAFYKIKSKRTGVETFKLYADEWKNYINNDLYDVFVKCRRCNAPHVYGQDCWCCDLETKVDKNFL